MVHPHDEVSLSLKKGSLTPATKMDLEDIMPVTEGQVLYDHTYVKSRQLRFRGTEEGGRQELEEGVGSESVSNGDKVSLGTTKKFRRRWW